MDLLGIHLSASAVTAIAALLGVLIGAVVGGVVDYTLERRRERTQARAAARLLRMEFSIRREQLEAAVRELAWWPFYDFQMEPWDRYKDLFAGQLSADGWLKVSQSAMELQGLGQAMLKPPLRRSLIPGGPRKLSEETVAPMLTMRENAIAAFNALAKIADDPERLSAADAPEIGSKPHKFPELHLPPDPFSEGESEG
jgi:hypothetical protein